MSSFFECRSQKRKKTVTLSVFFVLLGSVRAKAARRMLMKLIPSVNFTKKKLSSFSMQKCLAIFLKLYFGLAIFWRKEISANLLLK